MHTHTHTCTPRQASVTCSMELQATEAGWDLGTRLCTCTQCTRRTHTCQVKEVYVKENDSIGEDEVILEFYLDQGTRLTTPPLGDSPIN